ncbi:MAG: rRNA ((966)-N(2))-methyltransferase RsmD [Evtepia sp.]|jgi:16S rRNA (guanine(966)-N(2))-methyltransferase RsmD|nr:rRNA ((966)-N(2))-methyltransferase RsmD [Evtepia sp.]
MRVITGSARGRRLKELKGMDTRPTTDRVKEAIFSVIQFEVEGRRVLDLFGGTGQMGIEALSRGAAHCVFVDIRREAVQLIRENLKHTGLEDRAEVIQGDYLSYLMQSKETFDLVFLDPPYESEMIKKALQTITSIDKISQNGIIVCENGSNPVWPSVPEPYELQKEYRYGKIEVALYRRHA